MIKPSAFTIKSKGGLLRVLISDLTVVDSVSNKSCSIKAIWDTGATGSVITKKVAADLGVLPSGKSQVSTANGTVIQNTYIVSLVLPQGLIVEGVLVTEVDSLNGNCDALIGMDIVSLGDFSITNFDGVTTMSFRVPSQNEVDFAKKINAYNDVIALHQKSGLKFTSKCSCGSGKKFKNCHGIGLN